MMHPNYNFSVPVKEAKYKLILQLLKDVKLAATLPGFSDYAFEKKLIAKFPNVKIDCFERDERKFNGILFSFDKPKNIALHNDVAENYISSRYIQYDLIFLDLCGRPQHGLCDWACEHLTKGGLLALTECKARADSSKRFKNTNPHLYPVIAPSSYWFMTFMILRKDEEQKILIPCDLGSILKRERLAVQAYNNVMGGEGKNSPKSVTSVPKKYKLEEVLLLLKSDSVRENSKEVLRMKYLENTPTAEIAKTLGVCEQTVINRCSYAFRDAKEQVVPKVSPAPWKAYKGEGSYSTGNIYQELKEVYANPKHPLYLAKAVELAKHYKTSLFVIYAIQKRYEVPSRPKRIVLAFRTLDTTKPLSVLAKELRISLPCLYAVMHAEKRFIVKGKLVSEASPMETKSATIPRIVITRRNRV